MPRKKAKPPPEDAPAVLGAQWRAQMVESCESVPALVWKRVHKRFGLDLADPKHATAEQVHALLAPLLPYERVTREMLSELIDRAIPKVFPELKRR